jgi:hypothetical protein
MTQGTLPRHQRFTIDVFLGQASTAVFAGNNLHVFDGIPFLHLK